MTEIKQLKPHTLEAIEVACGRAERRVAGRMKVGEKDYSSRGAMRSHWYAMVWRWSEWKYPSQNTLPKGLDRASDRQASIYADAYVGDIMITHNYKGGVDAEGWLVVSAEEGKAAIVVVAVEVDGEDLWVVLPNGEKKWFPNPRA